MASRVPIAPMPKAKYMKLSSAAKAKFKAKLAASRSGSKRTYAKKSYPKKSSYGAIKSSGKSRSAPWHKGLAAKAGTAIGGFFGGPIGAGLGAAAGRFFSKITGVGDYKVASNSIMMGTDPPSFSTSGRGVVVRHREYIQDIIGSTGFSVVSIPINAGLASSFPWLSQVASNFEQYALRGMVFEFKSTSADALNSTNTALGTVIMATEYNCVNPNFSSKSQMENHEYGVSCRPSASFVHPIECARGETPISVLFTRSGSIPTGTDQRLYDVGNFQIATVGMQAAATIGELWVTYDVELLKPQIYGSAGFGNYEDHYRLSTVTTSNYFGATQTLAKGSNLGSSVAGSVLTFPASSQPEYYYVYYAVVGSGTTLTSSISISTGSAVTQLVFFLGDTAPTVNPSGGSVSNLQTFITKLVVAPGSTTTNNTLTVTAGTLPTGIVGADLVIVSANPSVLTVPRKYPHGAPLEEEDSESETESKEEMSLETKENMRMMALIKATLKAHDLEREFKEERKESKEEKKSSDPDEELVLVPVRKVAEPPTPPSKIPSRK